MPVVERSDPGEQTATLVSPYPVSVGRLRLTTATRRRTFSDDESCFCSFIFSIVCKQLMPIAHMHIDLASVTGTMKLVPGRIQLPRHSKTALELTIADTALNVLSKHENSKLNDLQSNPNDPPDVFFEWNNITIGAEVVELLPPNRLGKDAAIRKFKQELISKLSLGEATRDRVINIFLDDDSCEIVNLRGFSRQLAPFIQDALKSTADEHSVLRFVREKDEATVTITIYQHNLSEDTRISERDEPLIVLGAQNTTMIPERDLPQIVENTLQSKMRMHFDMPMWLIAWNYHPAFFGHSQELRSHLSQYVCSLESGFERAIHLHLQDEGNTLGSVAILGSRGAPTDRKS